MTAISDRARETAISIEVKKDKMSQRQSGEWAITFVLHPQEMPPELMNAKPGTRYTIALVETGDNGEPVERPNTSKSKEVIAHGDNPKLTGAEKRTWHELGPAQQAGIRCNEPAFWRYLNEEHRYEVANADDAAEAVREICGVRSRSELATNHKARVIWHQFDLEYLLWKEHPELVA